MALFQAVPPPPYWPSPTASASFINVQPNFPLSLNPTRPAAVPAGAAASASRPPGASPITTTYVRNETDKMQTIYLPPGGKVINVPGVGQTIYLPNNSAGISRDGFINPS